MKMMGFDFVPRSMESNQMVLSRINMMSFMFLKDYIDFGGNTEWMREFPDKEMQKSNWFSLNLYNIYILNVVMIVKHVFKYFFIST